MDKINQPLTNAQLEILKAFSYKLSPNELEDFKKTIANFFAQRAIAAADKTWEDKGLSTKDMENWLNTKMRKS